MKKTFAAVIAAGAVLVAGTPALAQAAKAPALGPYGYGAVKLGMSAKQAKATGKVVHKSGLGTDACSIWDLKSHPTGKDSAGFFLSKRLGVAVIFAGKGMKTPEGIGLGATMKQIKKAYPKVNTRTEGNPSVKVPGNSKAYYMFGVNRQGRLEELALALTNQDCVN
ncbi:hypothetical protein [Nonomuraea typhae]|uniref:hypothetical protein n=1 Tax=Nonomuraea typhae TaxID=2603600 RepID=UPI0012FAF84F|nr:hypothetical protein [Nonomuraea typhae]